MSKTFDHGTLVLWMWQFLAIGALAVFLGWGTFTAQVLRECYRPAKATATQLEYGALAANRVAEPKGWWGQAAKSISRDESGASAICIGLLLLAIAKFGHLRWQLELHRRLLVERRSNNQAQLMLGKKDLVVRLLSASGNKLEPRQLERRLASMYDLHEYAGPCITLGLLGTLLGLWMGFVKTLGPVAIGTGLKGDLQTALGASIVVVATASLSSIVGICVGQWVIEPLARNVDRAVDGVINELIEKSLVSRS